MTAAPRLRLPDGIDNAAFLRDYWQRKPLLMRGALPPDAFIVDPDTLAGLACEDDIEARLVIEHSATQWEVRRGPFDDDTFAALPDRRWTLLVQDADKFLPEVARMIEPFDFVPAWRIDDMMISYATDQGSVGPHSDAYDVFLIQAHGQRRWRLSHHHYDDTDLLPNQELRILSHFKIDEEWLLQPGDVLYLPPGLAHWGIAEGECMTWSLGFRAPNQRELAADWFQHLVDIAGEQRLSDPADMSTSGLNRIGETMQASARQLINSVQQHPSARFEHWLGCHLTEPKPQFHIAPRDAPWSAADLLDHIAHGGGFVRQPAARLAWSDDKDNVLLFCQGECRSLPMSLTPVVKALAASQRFDAAALSALRATSARAEKLLLELFDDGIFDPTYPFRIERADWSAQREMLLAVRFTVFVAEQGVPPELERDEDDANAIHLLARSDAGDAVGTARLLGDGKIGRMAVLSQWRGRGVGSDLLRQLLDIAAARGDTAVYLHAQCSAVPFYERLGFACEGDVFVDAGIDHRAMRLTLSAES